MCSTCTSTTINCSLNFSYGSRKLCVVCLTETLPIFTQLHRTNLCSKRDATYHDTRTHTHTGGTPHTIYLPQVASYVPNKRSCHCSSLPRSPHCHLPHKPHFATVYRVQKKWTFTFKELKSHKATECRKKDYTFLVGPSFSRRRFAAAAKWILLAASNANNCKLLQRATPTATPSHQLATAHTHTHTESSPKLFYVNINTKQKQKRRRQRERRQKERWSRCNNATAAGNGNCCSCRASNKYSCAPLHTLKE